MFKYTTLFVLQMNKTLFIEIFIVLLKVWFGKLRGNHWWYVNDIWYAVKVALVHLFSVEIIWPCPLSCGLLTLRLWYSLNRSVWGEPIMASQWYLVCSYTSICTSHFHGNICPTLLFHLLILDVLHSLHVKVCVKVILRWTVCQQFVE